MSSLPKFKIFVSSPGDVGREREMALRVINRLKEQFSNRVELAPYFWEHEPMRATQDFQQQIDEPANFDAVICILWSRLGTRLHASHTRPDGSLYNSGTEYEFENAAEAAMKHGTPELMVYWNQKPPLIPLKPKELRQEMTEQFDALEAFIQRWFFDRDDQGTLKAAFNAYQDLAEFEEKLEIHLGKLIGEKFPATADAQSLPAISWKKGSPFRGLQAFDFEHEEIFFGRTNAIGEILEAMRKRVVEKEPAFLVVQGNSGVGKSSVVRAGVIPLLTKPGVIDGVGIWRRAAIRPAEMSKDPALSLARALSGDQALPELTADGTTLEALAGLLKANPENAFLLIKGALGQVSQEVARQENLERPPAARLVLLVDQLEEIFTTESLTPQDRENIIEVIRSIASSGLVWVIATMRSDFFHRCDEIPSLVDLKAGLGQYQLAPPTSVEISQIIRKPAQTAGLQFEIDEQSGERLDDLLRDAAINCPDSLPLLEFCLEELYQRRSPQNVLTLKAYSEIGGVEGALSKRAEETFLAVSPNAQNQFDSVFRQLVALGEESNVTRRTASLETVSQDPFQEELVKALVQERLLISGSSNDGEPIVFVAHEALLRSWQRLRSWIESSMEFFRERFRLEYALNRWKDEGKPDELLLSEGKPLASAEGLVSRWRDYMRPEEIQYVEESANYYSKRARRRIRRLQFTLAGFAVLFVLSAIAGIFALRQQGKAVAAAEEAERQKLIAEAAATEALEQERIAQEQTRQSLRTTLQIQEGNFEGAREDRQFVDALYWLEEAKGTARILDESLDSYMAWQTILSPRVNQVIWESGAGGYITDLDLTSDNREVFVLYKNQFYHADLADELVRFEPVLFELGVRTVDSFVFDEVNRRLIYSDEEKLLAYSLVDRGKPEVLLSGLKGGVYKVHQSKDVWLVRNSALEIWTPDLGELIERYPYDRVDNGSVYIGVLDRDRSLLAAKIVSGKERRIQVINYKTGEVLQDYERQGAFFESLVHTGEYIISCGGGGSKDQSRLTIIPVDDPKDRSTILTPWKMVNISYWDESGFWSTCSDGKLRQWSYQGELIGTRDLAGIDSLNTCLRLPNGYLLSTPDNIVYARNLDWGSDYYSTLAKPPSRSLKFLNGKLYSLSENYLDVIDPKSGKVAASLKGDMKQFEALGYGDVLYVADTETVSRYELPEGFFETAYSGEPIISRLDAFEPSESHNVSDVEGLTLTRFGLAAQTEAGVLLLDPDSLEPLNFLELPGLEVLDVGLGGELRVMMRNSSTKQMELQCFYPPNASPSRKLYLPFEPDSITAVEFKDDRLWLGTRDGRVLYCDLNGEWLWEALSVDVPLRALPEQIPASVVQEIYRSEGDRITVLSGFDSSSKLAVAFEGGEVRVLDPGLPLESRLLFAVNPFPKSVVSQIIPLSAELSAVGKEGLVFLSTSKELVSMEIGSDESFTDSGDLPTGMGVGAQTGEFVFAPRGTHIEGLDPITRKADLKLLPGRGNVGEGNLDTVVVNPTLNRLVSYSNGNLFTWIRDEYGWTSNAHELSLDYGLRGSSIEFVSPSDLVVGSPYSGVPSLYLLHYDEGSGKPEVRFSARINELGDVGTLPVYVAGNTEYLFFGDNDSNEVWRVSLEDKSLASVHCSSEPRRLCIAGSGNDTLVVSHEGYVMLYSEDFNGDGVRVDFPNIGVTGEDYYIREMLALPETPYVLAGYKNHILLMDVELGEVLVTLPVPGYVWELNYNESDSTLHYITDKGYGSLPLGNLGELSDERVMDLSPSRGRSMTGATTLHSGVEGIIHYE